MQKTDFVKQSCEEFVTILASKEPVPGGGGASALVGAVGVALGNMVGNLTVGKKKYVDIREDIMALKTEADSLQQELLSLVRCDAEAFEPLSKAYGLPKETEEQKAEKARVMETALRDACDVPLEIMRKCCKAIDLHEEFALKGAAIAISDIGCGVVICKAALQAAGLNVFINTKSMMDRVYAAGVNARANKMLDNYTVKAEAIFADVAAEFVQED